jgi:hypothetical protein
MAVIRIKTDLGISYGLARKRFQEAFDRQKETYAQITGMNDEVVRKEQEKELATIKERQKSMKEMIEKIEEENEELKKLTRKLVEVRKIQKDLNEELIQNRGKDSGQGTSQTTIQGKQLPQVNPLQKYTDIENSMAVDPFSAPKRAHSSSEDETNEKVKQQSKKKETNQKEITISMIFSDDDDFGPEQDDYMITLDTWKDLPNNLRDMVRTLYRNGNYTQIMAYRRKGMNIVAEIPRESEGEEASKFNEMMERRKTKGETPQKKRTL